MTLIHLIGDAATPVDNLTSFGAAGLMGAMWLWERRTSQKRESQLDEAHGRIMSDQVKLEELIDVVKQNADAIARLCTTQDQLMRQLGRQPTNPEGKP